MLCPRSSGVLAVEESLILRYFLQEMRRCVSEGERSAPIAPLRSLELRGIKQRVVIAL